MGFCRRCGDIVQGTRCKCGGTAVAPTLHLMGGKPTEQSPDRWSKTYVTKEHTPPPAVAFPSVSKTSTTPAGPTEPSTPTRRFPRPMSTTRTALSNGVSAHIASTTAPRPASPPKHGIDLTSSSSATDILPSPHADTLAKVYGSVLQMPETLATFNCSYCATPFNPDSTLYPDPASGSSSAFLCRSCFINNGGSKGPCGSCLKQVLILPSDGGFVESAGKVWHRRCFRCENCLKDISDKPMVDLFGKPSCEDCFDHCLDRSPSNKPARTTPKKSIPPGINPGGLRDGKRKESSPTIQELSKKLGIKSREPTPAGTESSPTVDRQSRNNPLDRRAQSLTSRLPQTSSPKNTTPVKPQSSTGARYSNPVTDDHSPSTPPIDDLMRRLTAPRSTPTQSPSGSPNVRRQSRIPTPVRAHPSPNLSAPSSPSPSSLPPNTPDLASDHSDSAWSSPPTPRLPLGDSGIQPPPASSATPTPKKTAPNLSVQHSPSARCTGCSNSLFTTNGGRIVTLPATDGQEPRSYHAACFLCAVCLQPFGDAGDKQAVFIKSDKGITHVHCAPPPKVTIVTKPVPNNKLSPPVYTSTSTSVTTAQPIRPTPPISSSSSPRFGGTVGANQTLRTTPASSSPSPRFGSSTSCPGCHVSVFSMERGTVTGPQGTRWHASCLICGGKGTKVRAKDGVPGCGKRLDSAARLDPTGLVWCRECLDMLSSQPSPTRSTIPPSPTGSTSRFPRTETAVFPQLTGGSTIRQQSTGGSSVMQHLTGGSISPTRQLSRARTPSPTKQLSGGVPVTRQLTLRPKSVVGIRGEQGRGMFLVKQMSGTGSR